MSESLFDLGAISVNVVGNITNFKGALEEAGSLLKKFVSGTNEAMSRMFTEAKTANALGATVQGMRSLSYVAEMAGVSVARASLSLGAMDAALGKALTGGRGSQLVIDGMKKLGLSIADTARLPAEEGFLKIAEAIDKLPTAAERAGVALKLFRGGGANMAPLLAMIHSTAGSVTNLREELLRLQGHDLGGFAAAKIELAGEASIKLAKVWEGFYNHVAVEIAPWVTLLINKLIGVGEVGDKAGTLIHKAFEMVKTTVIEGSRWVAVFGALWTDMKGLAMSAIDGLKDAFNGSWEGFRETARNVMKSIADATITAMDTVGQSVIVGLNTVKTTWNDLNVLALKASLIWEDAGARANEGEYEHRKKVTPREFNVGKTVPLPGTDAFRLHQEMAESSLRRSDLANQIMKGLAFSKGDGGIKAQLNAWQETVTGMRAGANKIVDTTADSHPLDAIKTAWGGVFDFLRNKWKEFEFSSYSARDAAKKAIDDLETEMNKSAKDREQENQKRLDDQANAALEEPLGKFKAIGSATRLDNTMVSIWAQQQMVRDVQQVSDVKVEKAVNRVEKALNTKQPPSPKVGR